MVKRKQSTKRRGIIINFRHMLSKENKQITIIKSELKDLFVQGIDLLISTLDQQLNRSSRKFNDFIHLKSSYHSYKKNLIYGVVSQEDLNLIINKIRQGFLHLIDDLEATDLVNQPSKSSSASPSMGRMLYQIPSNMTLEKESKCVIRIAHTEIDLTANLNSNTHETTSIRIADIMLVNLLDITESGAFNIRGVNAAEQFIDKDDFTQWMFFVKPIALGAHPLMLKVSVIELINGVERKKDIVFEEQIQVSATASNEFKNNAFTESNFILNLGNTAITPEKSKKLETILSNLKKGSRVTLLLSLLFLVSFSFSFAQIKDHWDWIKLKKENKKESYEAYLDKHPKGKHKEEALIMLQSFNSPPPIPVEEEEVVLEQSPTEDKPVISTKEKKSVKQEPFIPVPEKKEKVSPTNPIADEKKPDTLIVITQPNGDVLTKKLISDEAKELNKQKMLELKNKEIKFPILHWERALMKSCAKLKKLNSTTQIIYHDMEEEKQKNFLLLASSIDSLHNQFQEYSFKLLETLDKNANKNKVYTSTAFHENYFNSINNKVTTLDAYIYKDISKFMKQEIDKNKIEYWLLEFDKIFAGIKKMQEMIP